MLASLFSFSISIFFCLTGFYSPLPSSENPLLSTLYLAVPCETHVHTIPLPSRVVCAAIAYYLCLSMVMRGCLPTQTQNNILITCPILHSLPDTEQKRQSPISCWMTMSAPILEIKTRITKERSTLQWALLSSPTCSAISPFLVLFSQIISHSFGGSGTSYSHKQNLAQCLYL